MNVQKVASLLGLAQKAGKMVSGEMAVEKAVRSGKAKAVIVASDASDATKKNYQDLAQYYHMPVYIMLSKEQLGEAIGKAHRAALAIMDGGFYIAITKAIEE